MATPRLLVPIVCLFACITPGLAFNGFGTEIDTYIKESAYRYQVDEAMLRGLVKIEDGWYGNVSHTGATGIGQFTPGTWNWLANTIEGAKIAIEIPHPIPDITKK